MRITREELLTSTEYRKAPSDHFVMDVERRLRSDLPKGQWFVWSWEDAPEDLRKICNWNGGDEDWVAVCLSEPEYLPRWVENLGVEEPDTYLLNGIVVYVGSHG